MEMSFFDYERIANGYAKDRPYHHPLIMNMIRKQLNFNEKWKHGLDVGCGSGLSSLALMEICDEVTGIDESEEMINVAKKELSKKGIHFIKNRAEDMAFGEEYFDIATVSGAVNWINKNIFLTTVKKLLKKSGWLVIYDNFISDKMVDVPLYKEWFHNEFLVQYPKPPRNEEKWSNTDVNLLGFHIQKQDEYSNTLRMDQDRFIKFMLTQSNVIAAVEQGDNTLEDVKAWFQNTLEKVFDGNTKELVFEGFIWYLQSVE